ncbi:hypothetical protein [Chryseobacterium sp. OV279]|uniref:hypothetical protein n=1 Tax=Chryseobacterium sp. OV279 TaxID=1500285 RepID=UPI00090F1BBD|nr:hypothetical protein [Chryseobacterium sp. OV279]SHF81841.1 hypothetical protein SAMN02787100_2678 [Chryseobacterium sp. OV279]
MGNNEKINFWVDLWSSIIENFLKKSFGLNLYSPHILIEDVITEITENSFKNPDNKKYFYSKLNYYFDNDKVIKKKFNSSFKLLRNVFNTERHEIVLELSKNIKQEFEQGIYFNENIILLKELLLSDVEIDRKVISEINYISECIIVEYLKKGYVLKEIKKFPKYILDDYKIIDNSNKIIVTNYPHKIPKEECNENYFNILRQFFDNLTIEDRIDSLASFFYKETEEVYYLFVVKGLKGEVELTIGDVTFYSTNKKRFVKEDFHDEEDLQNSYDNSKEKFIQAAVRINSLSPISSLDNAINILENTIDLIRCYFNVKTRVEIETSNYIVCKNGKNINSSWGTNFNDEFWQLQESLDLKRFESDLIELNNYNFIFLESKNEKNATSKIAYAVHWFSKAENSVKQEDKMLNYWIAIENLFNLEYDILDDILTKKHKKKIDLIQEIISSIEVKYFFYEYGWEMFNHYKLLAKNDIVNKSTINLPSEIIEKANLIVRTGEKIYLKKFIDSVNDIIKYETNPFFIEKLKDVSQFYNNKDYATQKINEQMENIQNDILMIYRFRNLIVHNAHFDNSLLPYYVWKIKSYSNSLIRKLTYDYKKNEKELSKLMLNIFIEKELFLNELNSGSTDFWKD